MQAIKQFSSPACVLADMADVLAAILHRLTRLPRTPASTKTETAVPRKRIVMTAYLGAAPPTASAMDGRRRGGNACFSDTKSRRIGQPERWQSAVPHPRR